MKAGYVYIMASARNGTLYVGVTSDLVKRVWEHRNGVVPGFTRRYRCELLVWYAAYDRRPAIASSAIAAAGLTEVEPPAWLTPKAPETPVPAESATSAPTPNDRSKAPKTAR